MWHQCMCCKSRTSRERSLKGLCDERFAVRGNSFGGMMARHLAAEFGDQILVVALICPVVVADRDARVLPPKTVVREDAELMASLPSEDASDYEEAAVIQTPENWMRFREAVLPGLSTFKGPTLILAGRQDHVVGFQHQMPLADSYPQATVVVLDRAGHNAHLDQPAITAALVGDWADRVQGWMRKAPRDVPPERSLTAVLT